MRQFLIFLAFFIISTSFAQIAPDKYFVEFTDKNGTPYTITHPEQFLSARSIERRNRLGVETTAEDLPVNPAYVSAVAATGVTVLTRTKWFNGVTIATTDPATLVAISELPFVKQVLKDRIYRRIADCGGVDKFSFEKGATIPAVQKSSGISEPSVYGLAYNQIHMLKGDVLHSLGYQGQGMVIAVLDAGFLNADVLPVFDSLRANGQILGTRDFVLPGNNVYQEFPHGMSVLSTMGGNLPGLMVGTAPKASYWLFRTEDVASENYIEEYNWVCGAEVADSVGADVINSSLGYTTFDTPRWDHTWADINGHTALATRGANMVADRGVAVVNSAGNEGSKPWRYISVPSDGDNVLAVGAVDSLGTYAGFSSHGLPGQSIKPNVVSLGQLAVVAAVDSSIIHSSGTSFSSPIMAGLVACLWQSRPETSVQNLYRAIEMSASQYSHPDTLMGYGIPDFSTAITHLGLQEKASGHFTIYPNPFTTNVTLHAILTAGGKVTLSVKGTLGQEIYHHVYPVNSGDNFLHLYLGEGYPAGFYFLTFSSARFSESFKLIKVVN